MISYLAIDKASYPKTFTSPAVSVEVGVQAVHSEPMHHCTCAC